MPSITHCSDPRCSRSRSTLLLLILALLLPSFEALSASHAIADMNGWASSVDEINIGPRDITQPSMGQASWGQEADVVGPALGDGNTCLSLGEEGSITLGFNPSIGNGPGDDFAIFENGFYGLEGLFAELATVEVSSNGVDFARFEVETLNPSPVSAFGFLVPTLYAGFAGLDSVGLGTGFDLSELQGHALATAGLLDLQDVGYVRVTDVIGDGLLLDDFGNAIYDPYPTPFQSSGFDLDGVGVIHLPEATATLLWGIGLFGLLFAYRHRSRRLAVTGLAAAWILGSATVAQAVNVVGFEDLGLGANSADNGSSGSGSFESGSVDFENSYDSQWGSWAGNAASTHTDAVTPGWSNQYSAVTGGGKDGSSTYGLHYQSSSSPYAGDPSVDLNIILPTSEVVNGLYVTNTTYAYMSMLNGDDYAKQFGAEDFFLLTVEGFDESGTSVGTLDFYLADFLAATAGADYILDEWTWLDTSSLGAIKELGFALSSSDNGDWGMNTPGYFAYDNLTIAPEPGTGMLVGLGLMLIAFRKQR